MIETFSLGSERWRKYRGGIREIKQSIARKRVAKTKKGTFL
jgi:hypothetical protein